MTWQVRFTASRAGSLGVREQRWLTVEADDAAGALAALYEPPHSFEHITLHAVTRGDSRNLRSGEEL